MIFKKIFLVLLLFVSLTYNYPLTSAAHFNATEISTTPINNPDINSEKVISHNSDMNAIPCHHTTAFHDCIDNFRLLTDLFSETDLLQEYNVPRHATTYTQAKEYLSAGFSADMSDNIIKAYLLWKPTLNSYVVVPTDSIPIITEADEDYITINDIDPHNLKIERLYNNCYENNDQYLYTIMMNKKNEHWIINELSFNATPQ